MIKYLTALGLLALISAIAFSYIRSSQKKTGPSLGRIVRFSGTVKQKEKGQLKFKKVKGIAPIKNSDTIRTEGNSMAQLQFASGLVLEILPYSALVVEKGEEAGSLQLNLLRGNYKTRKKGRPSNIVLVRQGIVEDPTGRRSGERLLILAEEQDLALPSPSPPTKTVEKSGHLSNDYISRIIQGQAPLFRRCFAKGLKDDPKLGGTLNFAFTIKRNGKTDSVQILRSTAKSKNLESCAQKVFERIRFRSFASDPIIVNYPITFE